MGEMFRELLNPLFLVLFCSMFLTAASELAPGQWVDLALTRTVHMPGILLLVYVSALMFVMRHFAGPLVHKLSPIGLLWVSCLLASLGLVALSVANSPMTGLLAATIWGTGVCYMWPTMLATASERFPRGGALLMGLMGTAGTLSIQFVLPDDGQPSTIARKIEIAGGEAAFNALPPGPELERVLGIAAQTSFRAVGDAAGDPADRVRWNLALRPAAWRISRGAAVAWPGRVVGARRWQDGGSVGNRGLTIEVNGVRSGIGVSADHAAQVCSMSCNACHSAGVAVRSHACFTWTHAVAYSHQNAVLDGRHASGPWSPLARLAEAVTASRCRG